MKQLDELIDRIISRVNVNLHFPGFDAGPYVRRVVPMKQFARFYAFYGITQHHRLHFFFRNSSLAGSYFLGKVIVHDSILYKSDIRGDELKNAGEVWEYKSHSIPLHEDEIIRIKDSYLIKTLVHNSSHDPESPEEFFIRNTIAMHYANIHGAPMQGSFLGPFATVDLTSLHDCLIGEFAYLQVGELSHTRVEPGQVWVHGEDAFDFGYRLPREVLEQYIRTEKGKTPGGLFMEFVENKKGDFEKVFSSIQSKPPIPVPRNASLSRYSVVKGDTRIGENVVVAQRAYLDNAQLGRGANCQENCFIINSRLEGCDVTAHGGKIMHAQLGSHVFVGFNAFLRGQAFCPLSVGKGCIVMPHTIIDLAEPLNIPAGQLIWGYIRNKKDLKEHSVSLTELAKVKSKLEVGGMRFMGSGQKFVKAFQNRINHVLEVNGAFYDGKGEKGHAQKGQRISFNTIQPHPEGPRRGIYPTITIRP
jgi:carbonic anhydrase/acetyltransferase-like protein (isoleucine patch superfamily)